MNLEELVVLAVVDPALVDQAIRRGREWRALGESWRAAGVSAARSIGLAASVVTAIERGLPLVSHDKAAWNLVHQRHRTRKLSLIGLADLLATAARAGWILSADAWAAYSEIAATGAGEQPGWPVATSETAFIALARQAGPTLKLKPGSR